MEGLPSFLSWFWCMSVSDCKGFAMTCARFALDKAACAGLFWTTGTCVDVGQCWMTSSFCQVFQDTGICLWLWCMLNCKMTNPLEEKPGAYPIPDDQGSALTCTRFALAKAACAGLYMGTWIAGTCVDVGQSWMTSSFCQVFQDTKGRWPTDYDGKVVQVFDKASKLYYNMKLKVSQANHHQDRSYGFEYVLVYGDGAVLHSVFVDKFQNGLYECINSNGTVNPIIHVDPMQKDCVLFQVSAELTGQTCTMLTRLALAEASCTGLAEGIWTNGKCVHVDQDWMNSSLCQVSQGTEGERPTYYDGKVLQIFDEASGQYDYLQLKISSPSHGHGQFRSDSKYVMIYNDGTGLHSTFVQDFENGYYVCMNSNGWNLFIDPKKALDCKVFQIKAKLTAVNPSLTLKRISLFDKATKVLTPTAVLIHALSILVILALSFLYEHLNLSP